MVGMSFGGFLKRLDLVARQLTYVRVLDQLQVEMVGSQVLIPKRHVPMAASNELEDLFEYRATLQRNNWATNNGPVGVGQGLPVRNIQQFQKSHGIHGADPIVAHQ